MPKTEWTYRSRCWQDALTARGIYAYETLLLEVWMGSVRPTCSWTLPSVTADSQIGLRADAGCQRHYADRQPSGRLQGGAGATG